MLQEEPLQRSIREMFHLSLCAILTFSLVLVELLLGHFSHCLTLLALTNHSLYNLLTLTFAIVTKKLSSRSPSLKSTFGWARIEVLGSLSSLVFLGSLSFATSIECLQTLFHSEHLDAIHHSFGVCLLAGIHFLVWIVVFILIGGYSYQQSAVIGKTSKGSVSLHLPSAKSKDRFQPFSLEQLMLVPFRHVFRDLMGCFLVLFVGALIFASQDSHLPHLQYVDPCVALIAIFTLILSSYTIAKESCLILLQTIPAMLDVDELKAELFRTFPSVLLNIHDMHIWCLVPGHIVVTMHIIFQTKQSYQDALETIEKHLISRGITTFTIQPEILSAEDQDSTISEQQEVIMTESTCLLRCSRGKCEKGF